MIKIINVLLVDDHPLIIEGYTNSLRIFEDNNPNYKINVASAFCCQSALESIEDNDYHVIFLDVRLPESKDGKFKSGEDLACYIKKNFNNTKIVMITGHYDTFTLGNILQNINPISLLFKGDVDKTIISNVLKSVMDENPYYSTTVLKLLRKNISSSIILDKINKLLLTEMSKGKKTKELTKTVPLSVGGIEKRKRQLREIFGASDIEDEELLNRAIEKGYL